MEPDDLLSQLRRSTTPDRRSTGSDPKGRRAMAEALPRREIRPGDEEWPARLKELPDEERVERLFVEGRRLDSDGLSIGVVGTRRPTAAGVQAAEELTRRLVEGGCTIVSGLAMGIDAVAHRTALKAGGYTIAVLGCGLDVSYPSRNQGLKDQIRASGTVITEYEEGTRPQPHFFPERNRIVAGLVEGVLVIEGGAKSGARITATRALDFNRKVWAVPGSIRNPMAEGPNDLIRSGNGALVTRVEHIFEEIAPSLVWNDPRAAPPLSVEALGEDERTVLGVLDDVPIGPDGVVRLTGLSPGQTALALSRLEVRGFVARRHGGYEISGGGGRARAVIAAQRQRQEEDPQGDSGPKSPQP